MGAENLAGFVGTASGTATGPSMDKFRADYEAEYGELEPVPYTANSCDAVVVAALAAAACEAKGMDITPVCIRDMLREVANPPGATITAGVESIRKAIELLKEAKAINYEGAAGSVDFDTKGDVVAPIEVWKYIHAEPYIETLRMGSEIPEK